MQDIKKGDKLLMQVLIRGEVREQAVSYAYERKGHLCVYWNGFVNTIEEMKGTTFTILNDETDKDFIKMNLQRRNRVWTHKELGYDFREFGYDGKFDEDMNYHFNLLPVPNYKTHLI